VKKIGSYTLDTLQIYFPWDYDLCEHFKQNGLGTINYKCKQLPLIYTDNTISTVGTKSFMRNYVLKPEYFNKTYDELGWVANKKNVVRPIIPAEKPTVNIIVHGDEEPIIRFTISSTVNDKEQYHLEYSSMSDSGKIYSNWAVLYFTYKDVLKFTSKIVEYLEYSPSEIETMQFENQKNQREEMYYVNVPIISHKFSIGDFKYAVDYLINNGFKGVIPSLIYDQSNPLCNEQMTPILKCGVVHTKVNSGFMKRNPQFVFKVSQSKIMVGDGIKKRVQGIIKSNVPNNNWIDVPAFLFLDAFYSVKKWHEKPEH
jgi:hypothetical protein